MMSASGRCLLICVKLWILYVAAGNVIKSKTRLKIPRSNEYKIKRLILRHYDKTTRPVRDDRTPCEVNVAISLYHILDTNEKEQTFTSLLAIRQRWQDQYLVWNASLFGGVDTIRIPADRIWTPDLVISNFAGDKFNDYMVTNAIVNADGNVLWLYPALIKTYCTLNVKYFPFDTQRCHIEFISWTHSGEQLDILYNSSFQNSVYYKPENQEWLVTGITTERHEKYYACCKEPYPDVRFTIHMRRGSLFYIVNLIAPCFLIFLISFLGFFLPVESGEKVNLETTILLALVVFLLMVGETMPPTPDAIPILGMFFGSTMVMVTVALVMAVIVTNIYAKKDSPQPAPRWVVTLAMGCYPSQYLPERCHDRRHKQDCNGRQGDMSSMDSDLGGLCGCFRQTTRRETHRVEYRDPQGYPVIVGGVQDAESESLTSACCGCSRHSHGQRVTFSNYDFERYEAEWKLVARMADRIFFWIFVVLSTSTQTILFMQMVPPKDDRDLVPTTEAP